MKLLRLLERFNDRLEKGTTWLILLLLAAMIVIVFGQVIGRYLFSYSPPWMEELSRFLMIWLAYIGASLMVRKGGHIGVAVIRNALPFQIRRLLLFIDRLILSSAFAVLIFYGVRISLLYLERTPITMKFPMTFVYMLFPITFFLMFFFCVEELVRLVVEPKNVGHLFRRFEDPDLLLSGELDRIQEISSKAQKGGKA
ncbi:MAG: TRAP transporter small permease [Dethiobacteria bacterium]